MHPESTLQLGAVINMIIEAGCAAGVVLNPATSLTAVEHVLPSCSLAVVMLVNPGYGGWRCSCCSVLQCVAVCCSLLQSVVMLVNPGYGGWRCGCCSVLPCVAVCCSVLQCAAVSCSVLQCAAVCCSVL